MTATNCRNHLDTLQLQLLGSMLTKGMGKQRCDYWNERTKEDQIIMKMDAVCYSIFQLKVKGYGRNVFAYMEGNTDLTFDISPRWRHFDLWEGAVVWPMHLGRLTGCLLPYAGKGAEKSGKASGPRPPSYPAFFCRPRGPARKLSLGDVAAARGREKATTGTCDFFSFFSRFFFPIVNDFFWFIRSFVFLFINIFDVLRFHYYDYLCFFSCFVIFDPHSHAPGNATLHMVLHRRPSGRDPGRCVPTDGRGGGECGVPIKSWWGPCGLKRRYKWSRWLKKEPGTYSLHQIDFCKVSI